MVLHNMAHVGLRMVRPKHKLDVCDFHPETQSSQNMMPLCYAQYCCTLARNMTHANALHDRGKKDPVLQRELQLALKMNHCRCLQQHRSPGIHHILSGGSHTRQGCSMGAALSKVAVCKFTGTNRMSDCSLFNAPQEGKPQQVHRHCGLAHGVEAEGDERQAEVGQSNVQSSADAIWQHCIAQTCY